MTRNNCRFRIISELHNVIIIFIYMQYQFFHLHLQTDPEFEQITDDEASHHSDHHDDEQSAGIISAKELVHL